MTQWINAELYPKLDTKEETKGINGETGEILMQLQFN